MNYNNPDIFTATTAPVLSSIRIADATTITNINTQLAASVTTACVGLTANANPAAVVNTGTQAQITALVRQVAFTFAEVGTSPNTDWAAYQFTQPWGSVPTQVPLPLQWAVNAIQTNGVTVRQYARYYAGNLFTWAKRRGFTWSLAHTHNLPPTMGYMGFDFVDGVPRWKLSVEEARVLDAARQTSLARSAARVVSTAMEANGAHRQI